VRLLLDKVKQNNIKNILSIMLSQGANTKANISFLTGLSNTTVSDCINEVQAINFVSKTGFDKPRGGRRSAIYTINKDYGMFLGITILKDRIFFALTDSCGGLVDSFFYEKGNRTPILSIYTGIEKACEMGTVLAIGIGVYGIVDYVNQTLISSKCDNWSNVPLGANRAEIPHSHVSRPYNKPLSRMGENHGCRSKSQKLPLGKRRARCW